MSQIPTLFLSHGGIAGEMVSPPGSVSSWKYTAPEVLCSGGSSPPALVMASKESDMWSFGVIAFQVLTSEPVFPPDATPEVVFSAVSGETALPWESGAEGAEQRLAKLRGLRRTILLCLSRNPQNRPSASGVLHFLQDMFDSTKSHGTFATKLAPNTKVPDTPVDGGTAAVTRTGVSKASAIDQTLDTTLDQATDVLQPSQTSQQPPSRKSNQALRQDLGQTVLVESTRHSMPEHRQSSQQGLQSGLVPSTQNVDAAASSPSNLDGGDMAYTW